MESDRRSRLCHPVALVVVGGLVLRLAAVCVRYDRLLEDPDSYWHYARALRLDGSYLGSAFRPPLYPLVLAPGAGFEGPWRQTYIAAVHLGLAAVGLLATLATCRRVGLRGLPFAAAALFLVADPLSVYWTTEVMTETLASALVALFLYVCLVGGANQPVNFTRGESRPFVAGVLAGLAVLCRPEVGAACLVFALTVWGARMRGGAVREGGRGLAALACGFALVWLPWPIRNYRLAGEIVPLTTHGGYTAALGNNEVWYGVLKQRGVFASYRPEELRTFQSRLESGFNSAVARSGRSFSSRLAREVAFDRYCYAVAWRVARQDHEGLRLAALHRVSAFWRIVPARPLPWYGQVPIAVWYAVAYVLALVGTAAGRGGGVSWRVGLPLLAFGLTLTAIHLWYWSDMRMRTPLGPAMAVAVGAGVQWIQVAIQRRNMREVRSGQERNG